LNNFNWTCPHCERAVTISAERRSNGTHTLYIENASGRRTLTTLYIVCPNPECRKFTLTAALYESLTPPQGREILFKKLQGWSLIPASASKHFPD